MPTDNQNMMQLFLSQVQDPKVRDLPAIVTNQGRITFRELNERTIEQAAYFKFCGLRYGEVLLVMQSVTVELYVTLLALFRMGCVALFPDSSGGLNSVKNALDGIRSADGYRIRGMIAPFKYRLLRYFVKEMRGLSALKPGQTVSHEAKGNWQDAEVAGDHPALVTFTSGSTGVPKGIVRTHDFLVCQHEKVRHMLAPEVGEVELVSLPVFVLSNLASGVTSVIPCGDLRKPGQMDPAPLHDQIERHQVTRLLMPPALCRQLLLGRKSLPTIRKVFTGGGPVYPELLHDLKQAAPQSQVTAAYGSTEAEPIADIEYDQISKADFDAMRLGEGLLTGKPVPGADVRIVDDEIQVSGTHVVQGYLHAAHDQTTKVKEGERIWHRTGDAGRFDEAGRLWLLGRHSARCEYEEETYYPFCVEMAAKQFTGARQAALVMHESKPVLVLELDGEPELTQVTEQFPKIKLIIAEIPMDKRHNSKVDYGELKLKLAQMSI